MQRRAAIAYAATAMNEASPIEPLRPPTARAPSRCRRGRPDRRAARQSRHAGRDRLPVGAALSEGISVDPRVIEDQGAGLEARPQRHHPAAAAAAQRPRLRQDLEPRAERIAAQDHHARAGREARARRSTRSIRASWSIGRCATAIRRSPRGSKRWLKHGCERILVVPLYPQYAAATTATVVDEVFRALMKMRWQPALRVAPPYYDDPVYIEALASSIEAELARLAVQARGDPRLVPRHAEGLCRQGRSLSRHCVETVRLLRERLGSTSRS